MKDKNRGGWRGGTKHPVPTGNPALADKQASYDEVMRELRPKQLAYAELTARGMSNVKACEQLDMHESTGLAWCKQKWYQPALRAVLEKLHGSLSDAFLPFLPKMLNTYNSALEAKDFAAARDVADRLYGKPLAHEVSTGRTMISIVFQTLNTNTASTVVLTPSDSPIEDLNTDN